MSHNATFLLRNIKQSVAVSGNMQVDQENDLLGMNAEIYKKFTRRIFSIR